MLRWNPKGRNKRLKPETLSRLDREKFKVRSALLTFAHRYPGALAAHFLAGVRTKTRGAAGVMQHSKDLRDCSVSDWLSTSHNAGLSETRDVREVQTIGAVMDAVSRDELSRAMDILAMRIESVIQAKSKGGSWEKSQKAELIPLPGEDLRPAGLSGLTS